MACRVGASTVSNFFSLLGALKKQDEFQKDLKFIQKMILENHPGVYNHLDPHFVSQMNKSYAIARETLNQAHSEEEKIQALKTFGKSFKDAHLWVKYDEKKDTAVIEKSNTGTLPQAFSVQKLENTTWIRIPTFAPSESQTDLLQEIIRILPQLRKETIVFDLRRNGGGNSEWGIQLLKALFGTEYTDQCLAKKNQNIYVEWRASSENLAHVGNFIPMFKQQFSDDHPAVEWAKSTCQGMQEALPRGDLYYTAQEPLQRLTHESVSPFKGKVIAVIDRGCGSACLDFLDGLKAMQSNVTFIGEPTDADSVYMELRTVKLPSDKGTLGFPIKVYRNRPRGHNVPHLPDTRYPGDLNDTPLLQKFVLGSIKN